MQPRSVRSSPRVPTLAASAALGLAVLLASGEGRADVSAEDGAIAEALFREGRALLEDGKIDAACLKLEGSQKLDPKVGTLLNVAACHELQGRTASAWAEFLDAARLARVANVRDPKALADVATARAEALAPKLQKLAIEHPDSLPPDLELSLDGRVIPRGAWATPMPVDPGERVVTARAPGKLPWTTRIVVAKPLTTFAVPALEALAPVVTPPPPPPRVDEPARPSPTASAPFLIGAGAFVVGSSVGGYFGLRAIALKKERDRACDALGCSPEGLIKQRDAHTSATISTVAFAVGAAGGLFALYWALRPQSAASSGPSAAFACDGRGTCGVVARGSF